MSPDDRRHGTHAGYQTHKRDGETPCQPCAKALTRWRKEYEVRKLRAGGHVKVPSGPARARLEDLTRYMTIEAIEKMSGVSSAALQDVLTGKWPNVRRSTSDKILAIKAGDLPPDNHWIDATGTIRRLQALRAIGWSLEAICIALGTTSTNSRIKVISSGDADRVTVDMHRRVMAAYDRMWALTPPAATKRQRSGRTRAIRLAAARGWLPPLAWDDDAIDDPDAAPDTGTQTTGGAAEDIAWLIEQHPRATAVQLAMRLGYRDSSAIQNALRRAGRTDLLERLARNAEAAA